MKTPKLLREKVVLSKYAKSVKEKTFELPNGEEVDYVVWGGDKVPVIIFPLTIAGEVIAINQFRFGANELVLEVPGGCQEAGQSLEETARGELLEETGYQAGKIVRLSPTEGLWFDPAACTESFHAFLAEKCVKVAGPTPSSDEYIELVTIPVDEWIAQIFNGSIRDSKTLAVTMLALPHLGYELMSGKKNEER